MITLPVLDDTQERMWQMLFELAARTNDWTLVGGQMVFLHALEHDRAPRRISTDIDVIVDVRVRPNALPLVLVALEELGFEPLLSMDAEIVHRFVAGDVQIDVLAPDGLGDRADVRTIGNAETFRAAGGSFALARSARVDVQIATVVGSVPMPDLVGALVIKARAAHADRTPERHLTDLALLFSLVENPLSVRDALTPRQRRYFTAVNPLLDRDHEAWGDLGASAQIAWNAFSVIRLP